MSRFLFTNSVLADEHYKAIGEMVAEFSELEWLLGACIIEIARIPDTQGNIITSPMNVSTLIQVLERLIHEKFGESDAKTDFSKIAGAIRSIQAIRNDITHGLWHESDKPGEIAHWDFNDGKRIEVRVRNIHVKDISGVTDHVARITLAVSTFLDVHITGKLSLTPNQYAQVYDRLRD